MRLPETSQTRKGVTVIKRLRVCHGVSRLEKKNETNVNRASVEHDEVKLWCGFGSFAFQDQNDLAA